MRCFMCKGTLEDKLTNFIVELDNSIIIIRNVPSQVCRQCGEVSYSTEIAKKLECAVNQMKTIVNASVGHMDVAIFEYSKVVA